MTDVKRKNGVGVERCVVLDLRASAGLDSLIVAAKHRTVPDAYIGMESHTPDYRRGLGDPVKAVGRELRFDAIKLVNRHAVLPLRRGTPPSCG
jgi:hypothetical protein